MQHNQTSLRIIRCVEASMFFALSFLLPYLTGQIPAIGKMFSPMHLPVLLCGMVCGPAWGATVGFSVPLIRCVTVGIPSPATAPAMAVELLLYGLISGLARRYFPQGLGYIYVGLVSAMLAGRAGYGVAELLISGIRGSSYSLSAYFGAILLGCWPGILLQLILIPPLTVAIDRWHAKNGLRDLCPLTTSQNRFG